MSETKETIEERYEKIQTSKFPYYRLHGDHDEADVLKEVLSLLDDLMAERGKMKELVSSIDKYGFECEGGPLENCVAWIDLKQIVGD